jgi:hypothetical protein
MILLSVAWDADAKTAAEVSMGSQSVPQLRARAQRAIDGAMGTIDTPPRR